MVQQLKSYFSIFFLVVFLFPTVIKEIHAIDHENVFHCDVKGERHLHTQQHDCTLCDFVLPLVFSSVYNSNDDFSLFCFAETLFPRPAKVYSFSSCLSSLSLRGPPQTC